jgi:aminopeptidase-like protein
MRKKIESYFDRLWPINRSLTGEGNRETLKIISEIIPLKIHEVPSGTQCFDWTVPPEWNTKEAWIKDEKGNTIVDFKNNNLHLLGYSEPFEGLLSFEELREHLYTLPDQPDLIPYLTSYYSRRWGFCLTHNQLNILDTSTKYQVKIESTLDDKGSMTYGDLVIKGKSEKEILFTTYICHPSLASNELSGPLVTSFIYDQLKNRDMYYSYRFVFAPETIGSIAYLSVHGEHLKKNLEAGFVVTCIGDAGNFTYKKSRRSTTLVDRAVQLILQQTEDEFTIKEFAPIGSDERQYCSPGFNLPVGSLMRTMYGEFPEYHTSGDNKDFICFEAMEASIDKFMDIIDLMEMNQKYINQFPNCEPQLGKRGLYPSLSEKNKAIEIESMMWILNYADGEHDLIEIIEKSKIDYRTILKVSGKLLLKGIIEYTD